MDNINENTRISFELLDGGEVSWNWQEPLRARLSIVGSEEHSSKKALLSDISTQVQSNEGCSVFQVREMETGRSESELVLIDLLEFEKLPSPVESQSESDGFFRQRQFFASTFIELLAMKKGIPRRDLLTGVSFKRQLEGPLNGYYRAAEKVEDLELRVWLLEEFEALKEIKWVYSKEGYCLEYPSDSDEITKAMIFIKGLWTFWAFTAVIQTPQQMLLILQPPNDLLQPNCSERIKDLLAQSIQYIQQITYMITCSMILSTETMFPIPQINTRYKLYMNNPKWTDFDISIPENRSILPERLLHEWEDGNSNAAVLVDDANMQQFVLRI